MLLVKVDPRSRVPVYRQIIQQISDLIEKDSLEKGTILPSSRDLAKKLGLDRTTVYRAYQELAALGYIASRPGSYTTVRQRPKVFQNAREAEESIINWPDALSDSSQYLSGIYQKHLAVKSIPASDEIIDFSPLQLDSRVYPADDFRRCLNEVLVNNGAEILGYGDHSGYRPLREDIARRLQIHGISITPGEILITNGAQQAMDLVFSLFAEKGNAAAIETPTYSNALPLLRHHKMRVLEVPMLDDGMDLRQLEKYLKYDKPAFIYTIPNFHNPTGITTSQVHREALLSLANACKTPIVEDGFEEEMKYFGKVVLPIKSMDTHQSVIYLGTFSKVLFPGIRLGWIAANKYCIQHLAAIKRFTDLSGSTLLQAAVSAFLRHGYYDLHIKKMHRIFRKRMQTALNALQENLPESMTWTKPDGGYTIWIDIKKPYSSEESIRDLLNRHKVSVSLGDMFFGGSCPHRYFRLSISSLNTEEIRTGIARLGNALHEYNNNVLHEYNNKESF